jgi:ribosomal protein L35AE/L33A
MSGRLHLPGKVLGFQRCKFLLIYIYYFNRGKRSQHPNFSLLEIRGVTSLKGAKYYLGKTVYYIYKVKRV